MKKIILFSLLVACLNGVALQMEALPTIDPVIDKHCKWNGHSLTCTNIDLPAGTTLVNGTLDNADSCGGMITFCSPDNVHYHIRCALNSQCVPPQEIKDKSYHKNIGGLSCNEGKYYDTLVGGWNLETQCYSNDFPTGLITLNHADSCNIDIRYCPYRGGSGFGTLACTNDCNK